MCRYSREGHTQLGEPSRARPYDSRHLSRLSGNDKEVSQSLETRSWGPWQVLASVLGYQSMLCAVRTATGVSTAGIVLQVSIPLSCPSWPAQTCNLTSSHALGFG